MSSCSELEAARLGRFLGEVLGFVGRWKSDEGLYESDVLARPGSVLSPNKNAGKMTYEEFQKVGNRCAVKYCSIASVL